MTHTTVSLEGTASHIPPEVWKNPNMEKDVKFDVYSFGIMLWELFTGETAYKACPQGNIRQCAAFLAMLAGAASPA